MMERHNITNTLNIGERVTSTYADIYFSDDFCGNVIPIKEEGETSETRTDTLSADDEWRSPSDYLIGIIDLIPPFTSKITRGKTHEGILAIGENLLQNERNRFVRYVNKLLNENAIAWSYILEHEKTVVAKKVKEAYQKILEDKSKILMNEINKFYEDSLQDLENHMRREINRILVTAHANIVSDLNLEIQEKLKKERNILEKVLQSRYDSEIKKIKHYYKLLLDNEDYRNNRLINHALHQRNDAINAFCRQIQAENTTSTMYMMCTERKKCRIKQFILDNYHSAEITEKLNRIKERQNTIDDFKERDKRISDINKEWEEKIKKILQLFLKFISFTLKLLPEQTTFLLDLEKMFVLQLNEIQKSPTKTSSILVENDISPDYEFQEAEKKETVCDKEPFVIIGDTADSIPSPHGSRETLAPHIDLPMVRLQRQFIYAKCDRYEEVKALLEAQRCKCHDGPPKPPTPPDSDGSPPATATEIPTSIESKSSNELLLMDDIEIFKDCPGRRCQDWINKNSFPYLNNYLDFTEEKYEIVKTVLGKPPEKDIAPELINPRDIVWQELPFSVTREKYHHVGTQYSRSEDDLAEDNLTCPCMEEATAKLGMPPHRVKESFSKDLDQIMAKRKTSLLRILHDNPNLMKMFTDESFDFIYAIK